MKNHHIWSIYYPTDRVKSTDKNIPYGIPLSNQRFYILNEKNLPCLDYVIGEICIAGKSLAKGYMNDVTLSDQKFQFITEIEERVYKTGDLGLYREDGVIEFVGRKDTQVKINGYRVELGEIENALKRYPGIENAVVVKSNEGSLTAYILGNKGKQEKKVIEKKIIDEEKEFKFQFTRKEFQEWIEKADKTALMYILRFLVNEKVFEDVEKRYSFEQIKGILNVIPRYEQLLMRWLMALKENKYLQLDKEGFYIEEIYSTRTYNDNSRRNNKSHMRKNKYTVYELQDEIKKIWSEELGKDLKINENYFLIGGNSLNAIRIVGEIKKLFDNSIDIPFSYIFSYPTVEKLSNAIYEILNGCLKAGLTSKELEMEVKLDIDLKGKSVPIKKEVCLLTGATGNLGNYLLKEILRQTNMEIYCLIRAKSMEAAQDRLEGVLNKINMSLYEEARVHIVLGDLGEPNLGMDMDVYEKLAEKVDCIYHNGAKVHFLSDYYELKNINVNGTKEIIRFAGYKKIKAIFYISTISIFSKFRTNDNIIMENDDISDPGILPIGYTQSKWVAEGLIWKAKECGIPVMVYRLGHVVGDSETGVCNDGDFIFRIIKSCLILGVYPDIKGSIAPIAIDDVAKIVVGISQIEDQYGKTYHVINTKEISFQDAVDIVDRIGICLQPLEKNEWIEIANNRDDLPITLFLDFFDDKYWKQERQIEFSTENLRSELKKMNLEIKPMTYELIYKYYAYIKNKEQWKEETIEEGIID